MKSRKLITIFCAAIFGLTASTNAQSGSKPTVFDSIKVAKEIADMSVEFEATIRKGDSLAAASFYAEDARIFNSGIPTTVGRQAITSFFGRAIRSGISNCKLTTIGVWGVPMTW